jgi:toxin ParE1/3/4
VSVRFTVPALRDLDSVLDYISRHLLLGASRVQARLKAVIELLPSHPLIGTRTNDPTIRRMTTSPYPYLIFYEVTDTEIIIHAVRHAARNPEGMPGARPANN